MTDDSLLGKEYAGYRLLSRLAEGGMGVVYLGEHTTLGRRAAVKVLKLEHCRDEGSVNRFLKEAQAVNAIGHDGIVDIYDFGRDPDGRAFFVMELLEGEPLSRRLGRDRVTWAEAVPIIAGTVRPLAAAHDKGFVHRDLKPDNIWLSYDPFSGKVGVKLLDFGIAKLVGEEAPKERLTRTGAIIGTPHYMAPEQINNQPIDGRTDVYAFGVILHEMLTGAPPYAGDTLAAVLMGHLLNDVPRLVPRPEQKVPPWVPGTVMRMLAKEPAGRPESIRAALAELEGGRTEVTAPVPAQKPPGARRRRRWPWAVLAGSLVVGAGALVAVQQRAPAPAAVADAAPRAIVAAPPDASPRAAAVIDYEKLRAEAQALLRGTLRAGEPAVRAGGSDALGEVRDAPSLPALVELAGADADLEVRAHAAGAAGTIGLDGKQSAALAALEKDAPAPLQVWYAEAQARTGDKKARARLAAHAESAELAIAFKAALALADVSPPGDPTAIARLTALAAREAELAAIAPHAGAIILSKLGRLRVEKARALLASALESSDETARLAAAEGLARLGDDGGRKVLAAVLADPASPNRLVAASILVALGDDSGYPLLAEQLGKGDPSARRLSARALGQIGERASVPALAARLTDADPAVRIAAAAGLLAIVGLDPSVLAQASVDWARSALTSDDWSVRAGAAALVGQVRERDGVVLLAQALADPQPEVRRAAAAGARKLAGPRAVRALAAAAKTERDGVAREQIVRSLAAMKPETAPEARRALAGIAGESGRAGVLASGALAAQGDAAGKRRVEAALADRDAGVREAAVEAAAQAGLVPALAGAVADKVFEVRLFAAETLARLGPPAPGTLAVLREAAAREDAATRARGIAALLRAGEKVEGAPAAELLSAPETDARVAALEVIAAMSAAEALPLLRRALFDPEVAVRQAAVEELAGFAAADRDGVVTLGKAALRDPDPGIRARAGAMLADLLEPLTPPAAADLPVLRAAADEIHAARQTIVTAATELAANGATLVRAASATAGDEAAVAAVAKLLAEHERATTALDGHRKRIEVALGRAEEAAGDAPDPEAAALLEAARKDAGEAFWLVGEAEDAALAIARKARTSVDSESSDATTIIAAAEASLAAGKLADARKDLDRAAKLLRAQGRDAGVLAYSYGELYDRQAARTRDAAERRRLLEDARRSFDSFAARSGGGTRAAAARARSEEIAEELRSMETTP